MAKRLIILLFGILLWGVTLSQTVIEMSHPADADVILLQVSDSVEADVIICITPYKEKAQEWDCMWKFKNWGFSNFSIFIAPDSLSLHANKENTFEDEQEYYPYDAKVYFTTYEDEKGYRNENFSIPGVMRIRRIKK